MHPYPLSQYKNTKSKKKKRNHEKHHVDEMETIISRQHYFWRLFTEYKTLFHTYLDLYRNTVRYQRCHTMPNQHRINPDSNVSNLQTGHMQWRRPPTPTRLAGSRHQKYRIQVVLIRCHKARPYREPKRKEENYTLIHEHYPSEAFNNM